MMLYKVMTYVWIKITVSRISLYLKPNHHFVFFNVYLASFQQFNTFFTFANENDMFSTNHGV